MVVRGEIIGYEIRTRNKSDENGVLVDGKLPQYTECSIADLDVYSEQLNRIR